RCTGRSDTFSKVTATAPAGACSAVGSGGSASRAGPPKPAYPSVQAPARTTAPTMTAPISRFLVLLISPTTSLPKEFGLGVAFYLPVGNKLNQNGRLGKARSFRSDSRTP